MNRKDRHACCHHHAGGFASRRPFAKKGVAPRYEPDRVLTPAHLDIRVRAEPETRELFVELIHTIEARGKGGSTLRLNGVGLEDLVVEGARARYDGEEIILTLPQPLEAGARVDVGLRYRVLDPKGGILFSAPSERDPSAPRYVASDHETERARYWLATVDHPSVRPTLSFTLDTPASWVALANGALVGEEASEGDPARKLTRYRLDQPCPAYLTCFAVGEFDTWDAGVVGRLGGAEEIPIRAYAAAPADASHLSRTFGRTGAMLEWMQGRLGRPYPFPKYAQFAAEGIGGAMENISLVSWDDRFLLDEAREPEELLLAEIVNVHEMAHAWFGDDLVCRDHSHSWLKESWGDVRRNAVVGARPRPRGHAIRPLPLPGRVR